MPSVLLLDFDPKSRLGWLNALRDLVPIEVVQRGELPVRRVRSVRPSLVLLSVSRGRLQETLRWSRVIKTDSAEPPSVGLFDPHGRIRDVNRAMEVAMADGVLRGDAQGEERQQFVTNLMTGIRNHVVEYPVKGWRRFLQR